LLFVLSGGTLHCTPSHAEQIAFLQSLQRLFEEGEFAATYKFALLLALTELAVEKGNDSGEPLSLELNEIAEKFIEIYWRQSVPYSSGLMGTKTDLLFQNNGRQAAIINKLMHLRQNFSNFSEAKRSKLWCKTIRYTSRLLQEMPLWRLQTMRREHVAFLYRNELYNNAITLLPGVTFNLRKFYGLVQHLVRSAWIGHIRANSANTFILGGASDLERFLFGSDRNLLLNVQPVLRDIQENRCFYCHGLIRKQPEVDHFIPWSRYPRDLGHNFVLAHHSCNRDKSDLLAAPVHLKAWHDRNQKHGQNISSVLSPEGFICDLHAIKQVASWAYESAYTAASQVWRGIGDVIPIDDSYKAIFS
jgi:hypothetical protein